MLPVEEEEKSYVKNVMEKVNLNRNAQCVKVLQRYTNDNNAQKGVLSPCKKT